MGEVREAVWKAPKGRMDVGYIIRRMDHALLVQRKGINEQYWIHERNLMAVFG